MKRDTARYVVTIQKKKQITARTQGKHSLQEECKCLSRDLSTSDFGSTDEMRRRAEFTGREELEGFPDLESYLDYASVMRSDLLK